MKSTRRLFRVCPIHRLKEMNSRRLAHLEIIRPLNVLIAMVSIFVAIFITGTLEPLSNILLACLSGGLIAAGANTINDYFDLEIDRVNRPRRPIPSGRVAETTALRLSLALSFFGVALSVFVNLVAFFIAFVAAAALFLYSYRLKRVVLWGNFVVALFSGLAFVYGAVAVDRLSRGLIPGSFAFLFHFGREVIKDIEDMEGDAQDSANTLPVRYGVKTGLGVATALFLILMMWTLVPYALGVYSLNYLIVVVMGVDLVLVGSVFAIWKWPVRVTMGRVSTILKADMLVGLLAIYLG